MSRVLPSLNEPPCLAERAATWLPLSCLPCLAAAALPCLVLDDGPCLVFGCRCFFAAVAWENWPRAPFWFPTMFSWKYLPPSHQSLRRSWSWYAP